MRTVRYTLYVLHRYTGGPSFFTITVVSLLCLGCVTVTSSTSYYYRTDMTFCQYSSAALQYCNPVPYSCHGSPVQRSTALYSCYYSSRTVVCLASPQLYPCVNTAAAWCCAFVVHSFCCCFCSCCSCKTDFDCSSNSIVLIF